MKTKQNDYAKSLASVGIGEKKNSLCSRQFGLNQPQVTVQASSMTLIALYYNLSRSEHLTVIVNI